MTDPTASPLSLRVAEARMLNPLIRLLRLRAPDDGVLPAYSPGAHVKVRVQLADGKSDWRHYSLIDLAGDPAGAAAPREYTIAVRREEPGRGGSRYMHEGVQAGDVLSVEPPRNDFPLHDGPAGAVLVAGGIGVTPLASMAARRRALGLPLRMVYAGRSRELMAFLPELESLLGGDLGVHADDERGGALDVGAILDACAADERVYVCGPKVMLDAVLAASEARGWPHERVHFELFSPPAAEAGDQPFEVELAQSGQRFTVPVGQTILDCMIEHGCDPLYDCKRGECGVCTAEVLEGVPDHRDYYLSDAEKAQGKVIQICISRAKSPRLVLDL